RAMKVKDRSTDRSAGSAGPGSADSCGELSAVGEVASGEASPGAVLGAAADGSPGGAVAKSAPESPEQEARVSAVTAPSASAPAARGAAPGLVGVGGAGIGHLRRPADRVRGRGADATRRAQIRNDRPRHSRTS